MIRPTPRAPFHTHSHTHRLASLNPEGGVGGNPEKRAGREGSAGRRATPPSRREGRGWGGPLGARAHPAPGRAWLGPSAPRAVTTSRGPGVRGGGQGEGQRGRAVAGSHHATVVAAPPGVPGSVPRPGPREGRAQQSCRRTLRCRPS